MGSAVKLWRLTARCEECGTPVRLRNTALALRLLAIAKADPEVAPSDVIQTYQCAAKVGNVLCNALVEIRVEHWREVP